ncbi:carboxypeptidase regulatory-like domain-containing protein [Bryobacter aggregatus]|uniref:carboxypeptidase regulatory-like domain-containing protein n=1 Tax=Bryobacter aggregatus TaxID=360054 RepID=UPI0004E19E61|nr:carboxypeptidase regulatory-like domain-containing protein [Bryobacter aggregatus]
MSVLLLASSYPAVAQVLYGSIVGTIQDASGAVVPGARVTVTNKATGFSREVLSDGNGNFSIASIPTGIYSVGASANGFKTVNRDRIEITINSTSRQDFSMEVGATTDQIMVEASTVALQTDRSETRTEISTKVVQELPLNSYRNYQALLNLAPGATPAATQNSVTDTPGRALRTFVNGTATNNNVTRLDGATNINIWLPHHVAYVAPAETVAEVNIATSGLDAEQGMAGGAAITVASISGTNVLHGAAWEYHENQELKARSYFQPTNTPNARYTLNIFGAKLGGPIIKNKLFYFAHAEWTRQRTGGQSFFTLPDAAIRSGNFSNYIAANGAGTIFDPATGNADGSGRTAFPGNQIPVSRMSPQALKVLALVPLANNEGSRVFDASSRTYSNNHFVNGTGVLDRGNYDGKLNWNRNEKHTMFVKYSMLQATSGGVFGLGAAGGGGVGGDPGLGDTHQYLATVGTNYTISPTMLFDATFGLTRMDQTAQGPDFGKNYGTDVFGIPGTNGSSPLQSGLPAFSFTSFSSYGQTATWMPLERHERSYTFTTNLSIIKSKHEIRLGFDAVHHGLNHNQPELDNPRGAFTFGGGLTANRGGVAANMYNSYAQFLLGLPTAMSKSLQYELMTTSEWQLGVYLRDRWQVTRKLTFNLGVRLERYPLMTRGDGKGLELLDPSTMKIYLGGRGSTPENPGIKVQPFFVAPRIGFAYRATEKTVVRAGYGMTIDPLPFSRPLRGAYPLTVASTFQGADSFTPYQNLVTGSLATGIPPVVGPDLSSGVITLPPTIDNRSPYSKIVRGYVQSWNATIERRLNNSLVGSVAYVGTQSTNVLGDRDINAAAPGAGNNGRPYYAQFGRNRDLRMWDGWMGAHYHGLQGSLSGNVAKGLFLKGAYTYSKAINMTDEDGWVSVNWNWGPTINRNVATAGYDRTQMFQMGFLYEIPFGKGKQFFKDNKFVDGVLGGWQFGGIYSAYSGTPFTVTADGGLLNAPGSLQTADQIGNFVYLNGKGSNTPYFSATNFAHPGTRFGTTGRNRFRGPGVANLDANLIKTIKVQERINIQFRAEAANLSNTPRFANPNANLNGSNFGFVTASAGGERQLRFGLRVAF